MCLQFGCTFPVKEEWYPMIEKEKYVKNGIAKKVCAANSFNCYEPRNKIKTINFVSVNLLKLLIEENHKKSVDIEYYVRNKIHKGLWKMEKP